MSYPSLEQYNEALQHPQTALVDPELKTGRIKTTGLGLPLALCGGFALTYTVNTGSAKYAVRCFHKQSNALEKRYNAISNRIKSLRSLYFLDFEFQPQGIRINGNAFPVVKMAWASGDTLGEFLERHYRNKIALQQLNSSLRDLASFLERQNMAHGDIQPGNVMVSDGGRSIQLIDYDGMFVNDLRSLGSAELGHRNFQHPRRSAISWNPRLDRFSFIALNLALRVLEAHPDLWRKTQSDGDAILFKVNDFADPDRSTIFNDLLGRPQFAKDAKNLANVCKAAFDKIPTLEDFLVQKNIPQVALQIPGIAPIARTQYMAAFPALDATNYTLCFQYVGDRVELIGRIVEVKHNKTHDGRPYIFINFGPWKGEAVKISIWSEGLSVLTQYPDQSWVGKWISVIGLMEPPYRSLKYNYSHLSISITQSNQLHIITESDAKFRLAGTSTRSFGLTSRSSNKEILDGIRGTISTPSRATTTRRVLTSANQDLLQAMKGSQPASTPLSHSRPAGYTSTTTSGKQVKNKIYAKDPKSKKIKTEDDNESASNDTIVAKKPFRYAWAIVILFVLGLLSLIIMYKDDNILISKSPRKASEIRTKALVDKKTTLNIDNPVEKKETGKSITKSVQAQKKTSERYQTKPKKKAQPAFSVPDEKKAVNRVDEKVVSLNVPASKSETAGKAGFGHYDLNDRLKAFLNEYCRIYEQKDLDKFKAFFTINAVEKGKPFNFWLPKYRQTFDRIDSMEYNIELEHFATQEESGLVKIDGIFHIRAKLSGSKEWRKNSGQISMLLEADGNSFKVRQLDY